MPLIPFPGQFDIDTSGEIAFHMDFLSLVAFSHTCLANRGIVQDVLSDRIILLLQRRLHHHARAFRDIIFDNGVVVVGSSVMWLMNSEPQWSPRDLNLIAPAGKADEIAQFLKERGFEEKEEKKLGWRFNQNATRLWEFEGPLPAVTDDEEALCGFVTVMESRTASVWPCILASEATSHKDVITSHYIVSLTPRLSCHNTLYVAAWDDKRYYAERGINVIGWPSTNIRCDLWCPSECRYLNGGQGVGLLEWRMRPASTEPDFTDVMVMSEMPDRPGSFFASTDLLDDGAYCMYAECYNPTCPRRWQQRGPSESDSDWVSVSTWNISNWTHTF
ncbi:hypothetical protein Hypma_000842 [Hypsizygus marmoreus]|uniref:Uncharacterized protein n=1 Tax=Hypsizygus marmoreus TaxID=39966 RepID=A0A369J7F2_HYPMA|nr:hypothetical protein Hypma_000842 [Hypsizygus marmoreus]